jgi:hypothetical protein
VTLKGAVTVPDTDWPCRPTSTPWRASLIHPRSDAPRAAEASVGNFFALSSARATSSVGGEVCHSDSLDACAAFVADDIHEIAAPEREE